MRTTLALLLALSFLLAGNLKAEDWMRFRGPNGQGVSSEKDLPVKWSAEDNIAWKTAIGGKGWSSPIVYKNRIFLTTSMENGVSCRIICVDRESGDVLWNKEVHRQKPGPMRRQNSYATPTPVTDGKHVYSVFYDGAIIAVDFDGNIAWKNTDVRFFSLHGLGASPVLTNGQLIMPFDGSSREENRLGWKIPWKNAVVVSVNTAKGDIRWEGKRGESRVGHVTPILADSGKLVISAGGDRVQAHDTTNGKRIWSIYSQGEGVTPSPVIGDGVLYTSSGFEAPTIRAIRLGGSGDVTKTHIEWELKKGVPALASLLYLKPYLYTITRDNILHCIEAKKGEIVWMKRLEGTHWASPVLADGRIYILSEDGVTLVIRPGDKYDEIGRNELKELCYASMAVSQGQLFIRSDKNLYCIGK